MTWKRMYSYMLLDMRHPWLARGEASALLKADGVEWRLEEILHPMIVVRADPVRFSRALSRAAFIREAGVLVAIYDACTERVVWANHDLLPDGSVWVVYRRHRMSEGGLDQRGAVDLVSRLGASLGRGGGIVHVHHVLCTAYVGVPLHLRDSRGFEERRPRRRPVFKPGTLDAYVSRALVNLSVPPRGGVLLDPFCGVGGFCIEALFSGVGRVACGDVSFHAVDGARVNLGHYGFPGRWLVYKGDATRIPLPDQSVDSVATDPPYGRSSSTRGRGLEDLYRGFLDEAYRVLKPGGGLSFAGPAGDWLVGIAEDAGFSVWWYGEMHVHGGLVRGVVAAEKRV